MIPLTILSVSVLAVMTAAWAFDVHLFCDRCDRVLESKKGQWRLRGSKPALCPECERYTGCRQMTEERRDEQQAVRLGPP